jgi:hypothetical protein
MIQCAGSDTAERVSFGLWAERELKPTLEKELGMTLVKTADEYDFVDFVSEDGEVVVELKARRKVGATGLLQTCETFRQWLFPSHKEPALKRARSASLFYYWVGDGTLWRLDYSPWWAGEVDRDIPEWHRQYQEHWYIPKTLWRRVEVETTPSPRCCASPSPSPETGS